MWAGLMAGALAGFVLGFLGAGGTVVGLPVLLYFAGLEFHTVLGTNALGVALIATALLLGRLFRHELRVAEAVVFALPGILGILVGAQLGLVFPGQQLIILLSFVLVVVAGWMFYLSTRHDTAGLPSNQPPTKIAQPPLDRKLFVRLIPLAFIIGVTAGFFGIGGGFMIVPGLIIAGSLSLKEAAASALLPIAAFAGLVGLSYWAAGSIDLGTAGIMLPSGIVCGLLGVWLATRFPRKIMQRIFAVALVAIGVYMAFH
jgi:uncharacterized protein